MLSFSFGTGSFTMRDLTCSSAAFIVSLATLGMVLSGICTTYIHLIKTTGIGKRTLLHWYRKFRAEMGPWIRKLTSPAPLADRPLPTPTRIDHEHSLAELRHACQDLLAALALPTPCDIAELCARLSDQRGRPIRLVPIAMQAEQPCGLWVASDAVDFVLFEAKTTRPHQDHIIAHELAHIICDHRGITFLADSAIRLIFPDLNPELVRDVLPRSNYSDLQEREAEIMASLILTRQSDAANANSTPALNLLSEALGIARGRCLP
ncbi:hypothetical protein [Streptomyces ehimensis]|uniref:IrrE N-terminal-like domain-containing protein n=1 Tax=Streptomyces ehimensis TaxID=68195 RepID=A0ABV9BWM1_9ACTN